MVCPPGRVKTRDQPLTALVPVLVMVMFSVRPLFQALTATVTRHAPLVGGGVVGGGVVGGGVVGGGVVGGGVVGGGVVGLVRPKNCRAAAAIPPDGRLCPAPWMLYASTWTVPPVSAYRRRFQLAWGVSV